MRLLSVGAAVDVGAVVDVDGRGQKQNMKSISVLLFIALIWYVSRFVGLQPRVFGLSFCF